jgi:uncharacterized membrane protein
MTASSPGGQGTPATGAGSDATSSQEPGAAALERTIARLLTAGTDASIAYLVGGVALMLINGIAPLSGGPRFDFGRLVPDLVALRPEGLLWLGIVLMVATPASRVAASLVGYARRGERTMAIVAGLILVVIASSVVIASALEG